MQEPIAVVGTGCRFPGESTSPSKLWELLKKPRDLLTKVPSSRFDSEAFYHSDNNHHGTTDVQSSYFLSEDVTHFDAPFFGLQPVESEAIDPQQRLLMETVYDSLSAAGIPIEKLRGSPTAVYVGLMCDDWSGMLFRDWDAIPTYSATGTARSIMSNRISYFFDWHGPSMTIDTACSSSLVAVHQAAQTLRSGESRVAIAAGANLILSPGMYIAESKLKMLSPTGRSRMWDRDADGYARGEGLASVVLKTLSAAIEDGDNIECIIRDTAVNQDGRTTGITMPSNLAQTELIRQAYRKAGLDPTDPKDRPQFFHAHGTGTQAGDPQEAEAIKNAFFPTSAQKGNMYVGSIKTIIGHTEGTAGLASLIGTSLALQNKTIPPNMHFNNLSPKVAPFFKNLKIPKAAVDWPVAAPGQPLRASVNSFGFGGTNAHAILESYVKPQRPVDTLPLCTPLTFSANSESSLKEMLASYQKLLAENPNVDINGLARTLQARRSALKHRKVITGVDATSVREKIEKELAAAAADSGKDFSFASTKLESPSILGVFTGQGAQWPRMGAELIDKFPMVREKIQLMDKALAELPSGDRPSWKIADELTAGATSSKLALAAYAQPLCTAVQVVLVDVLQAAGVTFKAVVGHSSGEIGAAYAAGFVSATEAIRIAYYRGVYTKLAKSPSGSKGAMMAVGTSYGDALDFCNLDTFEGRLVVAAANSSSSVTLSGDEDAIDEAEAIFKDEGVFARKLRVDTAYHSYHMKPCSEPYVKSLGALGDKPTYARGPQWFSSVRNGLEMTPSDMSAQYWSDNMLHPVKFADAVSGAIVQAGPFDMAVEVGPHPALQGPALNNIEEFSGNGARIPYFGLLSRDKNDIDMLATGLGSIWSVLGSEGVNFDAVHQTLTGTAPSKLPVADLPTYPFDHQRSYWTESRVSGAYRNNARGKPHPVLGMKCVETSSSSGVQYRNILRVRELSWLTGHQLQGQTVFPATGYVVMAIEALRDMAGDRVPTMFEIKDMTIDRALAFNDNTTGVETVFSVTKLDAADQDEGSLTVSFSCSSGPMNEKTLAVNSKGQAKVYFGERAESKYSAPAVSDFDLVDVDMPRFYKALAKLGYNYSPPFYGVQSIRRRIDFATGNLEDQAGSGWEDELLVHPGLLDSALQTMFAAYCSPGDERLWSLHVPTKIGNILVNPEFGYKSDAPRRSLQYCASLTNEETSRVHGDIEVMAEDGKSLFIQMEDVTLQPFSAAQPENDSTIFSKWVHSPAGPNGDLAATGDDLSDFEMQIAMDLERVSFWYLRHLHETITPDEKANTLIHYRRLLNWASHVVDKVTAGENEFVRPEHLKDTHDDIVNIMRPYGDRVDVRLIEVVGENLTKTIRDNTNILEHMTKDGVLDHFYELGLGLTVFNQWIAGMVSQIAERYPHMHILEIGGGTGGSTGAILEKLGPAFSSYTFTDISSAFFEKAQKRFETYANRMIFKTFDMERTPEAQGYNEGKYDIVVASNVLHATDKLDEMMTNVRRLLKPGGFLINLEVTSSNVLRTGLPMGGLKGWWIGADEGRPWGPSLTLPEWDALTAKNGFAGIESHTPNRYGDLHPFAVFSAQAVDDRVSLLREPMQPAHANFKKPETQLVVVGGRSPEVAKIADQAVQFLSQSFKDIKRVPNIEALRSEPVPLSASVLSLCELDEPLLSTVTAEKLDGLKAMWSQARNILWVTRGARAAQPHSYMMIGIGRAMKFEYPHVNLQSFDIERLDAGTPKILVEAFLRMYLLESWGRDNSNSDMLWSLEPELQIKDELLQITRLKTSKTQNARYNSARRGIAQPVDAAASKLRVELSESSADVFEISPLRRSAVAARKTYTLRVAYTLARPVYVQSVGYLQLCYGLEVGSNAAVVALTNSNESIVQVPADWIVNQAAAQDPAKILVSVAAQIQAQNIINKVPAGQTAVVNEPEATVAAALSALSKSRNVRVAFTTADRAKESQGWVYVKPRATRQYIQNKIPSDVAFFADFSASDSGRRVADAVPVQCPREVYPWVPTSALASSTIASSPAVGEALNAAWTQSVGSNFLVAASTAVEIRTLSELADCKPTGSALVIDWLADKTVAAKAQAIDSGVIFRADKTYLMVGLSGQVGQSLCEWMVKHGARNVVLTSRNPKANPKWIEYLAGFGATVKVLKLDITSNESLLRCHDEITATMPPVGGVANGAMVLEDTLFQNMSYENLSMVLAPKVKGTQFLNKLFENADLDFFILFSSITGNVGNSGQSNYIAANMYMTALAAQRKQAGKVASVIDISSLVGIGYVERSDNFDADYFSDLGYINVSEQDVHKMFAEAMLAGRPESAEAIEIVTGFTPSFADVEIKAQFRQDIKFSHFVIERPGNSGDDKQGGSGVHVRAALETATTEDQVQKILIDGLLARLRQILQLSADDSVSTDSSLVEQGVDSLVAVEVRSWFLKEIESDMPVLKILGGSSVQDLIQDSMANMSASLTPALVAGAKSDDKPAATNKKTGSSDSSDDGKNDDTDATDVEDSPGPKAGKKSKPTEVELRQKAIIAQAGPEKAAQMSFGQSRFWFLRSFLKDPTTFNMAIGVRLEGPLRVSALEAAVEAVASKHEALRTRWFTSQDQEEMLMQGVLSRSLVYLEKRDIAGEGQVADELDAMRAHEWDLGSWESIKCRLLRVSDTVNYLIIGAHHIAMDGISFQVFFADLEAAYRGHKLPDLPEESQYRTFAALQRQNFADGSMKKAIDFFKNLIPKRMQPIALLPLSKLRSRPVLAEYGTHQVKMRLDPALAAQIRQQARAQKSTTFHFYLAALQTLLFSYLPATEELTIGIADANRTDKNYIQTMGFFLNLLPLYFARPQKNTTFGAVIQDSRNKAYGALQNSEVPFDVLLDELAVARSGSATPVFQVFMDYRQGVQERQDFGDVRATGEDWRIAKTGYDVTLDIIENPGADALVTLKMQAGLYEPEAVQSMLQSYVRLVETFAKGANSPALAHSPWAEEEVEKAIELGKGEELELEWKPTISHHIAEFAEKNPDAPALKDDGKPPLSYRQMHERAYGIAAELLAQGVSAGDVVGVLQQPGADWFCAMIAILHVGACYLPLDLKNGVARLSTFVKAMDIAVITVDDETKDVVEDVAPGVKRVNVTPVDSLSEPPCENQADEDEKAVILFTSGSTGTPKAFPITHASLAGEVEGVAKGWNIAEGAARVLQQSAYSFDKSLTQGFAGLANGGCLHIVPAGKRGDPVAIARMMYDDKITYASFTPSEYAMLLASAGREDLLKCTHWRIGTGGGELLTPEVVNGIRALSLPDLRLVNTYGPAETTLSSTYGDVPYKEMGENELAPCGWMVPNYSVLIMDESFRPVPQGVSGEIVIGGQGVSAGYIGRDDLTAEKFVPDEHHPNEVNYLVNGWSTLYRTGDRGRLREDGALFCEGRMDGDTQVKLRGFRIELGEIENAVVKAANGALRHAVVMLRKLGDADFLCAHVVFAPGVDEQAQDALLAKLPSSLPLPPYMVPSVFAKLAELPLSVSTKVDRKAIAALPLPEGLGQQAGPSGELTRAEQVMHKLWSGILPLAPALNAQSDFFAVGGNSLLLVKLQTNIRTETGFSVRLMDLMQSSSLAGMAAAIAPHLDDAAALDWDAETALDFAIGPQTAAPPASVRRVLLTGATGYLGRNLLPLLVADPRVEKIYCVAVRDASTLSVSSPKIIVKAGDLTAPDLGLSAADFSSLSQDADAVLHCAANRAFWDSYDLIRPLNVTPARALARLAAPRRLPVHFVSSGAVAEYDAAGAAPPADGTDGYVASKWAAERILRRAAADAGLPVVIHRPVGGSGPADSEDEARVLAELAEIAKVMALKPLAQGFGGKIEFALTADMASAIASGVLAKPTPGVAPKMVTHPARFAVPVASLAGLAEREDVKDLEGLDVLKWFGRVKKNGFGWFTAAQEIVMGAGREGAVVSRR